MGDDGDWMTSQLCHNFRGMQAVNWTDGIETSNFLSQVNSLMICPPCHKLMLSIQQAVVSKLLKLALVPALLCYEKYCSKEFYSAQNKPCRVPSVKNA